MDGQTLEGKAPLGVALVAAQAGVPVVALVGGHEHSAGFVDGPFDAVFSVVPGPVTLDRALAKAATWVETTARMMAATWAAGRRSTLSRR